MLSKHFFKQNFSIIKAVNGKTVIHLGSIEMCALITIFIMQTIESLPPKSHIVPRDTSGARILTGTHMLLKVLQSCRLQSHTPTMDGTFRYRYILRPWLSWPPMSWKIGYHLASSPCCLVSNPYHMTYFGFISMLPCQQCHEDHCCRCHHSFLCIQANRHWIKKNVIHWNLTEQNFISNSLFLIVD